MNEESQCVRREACAIRYCDNPSYGFVRDEERVQRLIFSPKMFDEMNAAVRRGAFGINYLVNGMSVDRYVLINQERYPGHLKELADARRERKPLEKGQAVAAAVAVDIRGVSASLGGILFICPSSRKHWPPHADIRLKEKIQGPLTLKLRNALYRIFFTIDVGIKFPI